MNRSASVFGVLFVVILLAGSVDAQQDDLRQMWWNETLIVDDLSLSKAQRKQMDVAYQSYSKARESMRRKPVTQRPYLEALEEGDWKTAKAASTEWLAATQGPTRVMIDLKLAVLPILTAEQRVIVVEKYPGLIRRNWNRKRR